MTLAEYLLRKSITQAEFARQLEIPPATVSRWCAGVMRPRAAKMREIEAMTEGQVRAADWFLPAAVPTDGEAA